MLPHTNLRDWEAKAGGSQI
ncbi:rCG31852 [Rattus norvegicus]|uniref:RCG31852 n=1 Tax=Rattus norvegicus TaxID=10116 RepID=A6JNJ2_RAT|nr:rCG31852 [Rattus norvegicus]